MLVTKSRGRLFSSTSRKRRMFCWSMRKVISWLTTTQPSLLPMRGRGVSRTITPASPAARRRALVTSLPMRLRLLPVNTESCSSATSWRFCSSCSTQRSLFSTRSRSVSMRACSWAISWRPSWYLPTMSGSTRSSSTAANRTPARISSLRSCAFMVPRPLALVVHKGVLALVLAEIGAAQAHLDVEAVAACRAVAAGNVAARHVDEFLAPGQLRHQGARVLAEAGDAEVAFVEIEGAQGVLDRLVQGEQHLRHVLLGVVGHGAPLLFHGEHGVAQL